MQQIPQKMQRFPRDAKVLTEGKTKIMWVPISETGFGCIQNKPWVTAGDGKYWEHIPGKEIYVTTATSNIFELLSRKHIRTHFHSKVSEDRYIVRLLNMIPIEIVVRERAFGSYLKRYPYDAEGMKFANPLVEFFYKNDHMSDPFMIWSPKRDCFCLYRHDEPLEKQECIGELKAGEDPLIPQNEAVMEKLRTIATETFVALRDAFLLQKVVLADFKIECGYDYKGRLVVGDQIDGDSCRFWIDGDKTKAIDKDLYRKIVTKEKRMPTTEERLLISDQYRRVAEITASFARL